MSNPIDLTRCGGPFTLKNIHTKGGNKSYLPDTSPAKQYLCEVELSGNAMHCCTLKDVSCEDLPNSPIIVDGDYQNYRLAMMTIPKGFQYVNYRMDAEFNIDTSDKKARLGEEEGNGKGKGVHTLVLLHLDSKSTSFHNCIGEGNNKITSKNSPPYACAKYAISITPDTLKGMQSSNSINKPFHLFYFHNEYDNKDYYAIPLLLSQGTVAYYIIKDDNKCSKSLKKFAKLTSDNINNEKDYWTVKPKYFDYYDIFTSKTCVKPKILTT